MFSFKKKSRGAAEVHLAVSSGSGRPGYNDQVIWRSDEDIIGTALFRLPSGVGFSRSKILLKGVVTTQTEEPRQSGLQPKWRAEKLPFLAVALESKAGPEFQPDNGAVRIPFRFNLDECKRTSGSKELPPSTDSRDDSKWWSTLKNSESGFLYDVTYSITASSYYNGALTASIVQSLLVLPILEAQPPLYAQGEYFQATTSPRQSKARRKACPHFQVAAQEPQPVRLNASGHVLQSSIQIPLVLKLLPREGRTLEQEDLPTQCNLKAQLVARTFVTPNGSRSIPTTANIRDDEDAHVRTFRSNQQDFTLSIATWNRVSHSGADQFVLANFPYLFNFDVERNLRPTFFTPILSRQYAIELRLTFPESSAALELSLPLQAVHETEELGLGIHQKQSK